MGKIHGGAIWGKGVAQQTRGTLAPRYCDLLDWICETQIVNTLDNTLPKKRTLADCYYVNFATRAPPVPT